MPATANAVRLHCVDLRGRSIVDRRLVLPPRPVTDSVYDALIAIFSRAPGRTEADLRNRIHRPRDLPVVLGMMLDNGGLVWLQRSHRFESTARWLRLRPDGTPHDSVTFPNAYRILRSDGDTLWAARADSNGLESLERCTVPR